MALVDVVLEADDLIARVTAEVHDVRTEVGDAVQQVVGGRGGADVELDLIALEGPLDGAADLGLLPADAQVTFGGGAEHQDPKLLDFRGGEFAERVVDLGFRGADPRCCGG